ncbi:10789_t:CDS:2, partial [Cetraspora pellucida]
MSLPDNYPFLTRKEFDIAAKLFIEQSKRSSDEEPWSWVEHESLPTVPASEGYFTVDYHIIYSTSYKVPVLYFNAYNSDGTLLTNDEIYSNLVHPLKQNDIKSAGFHGAISQQDHPTLLLPFYYLHPCETATLMTSIVSDSKMNNNKLQIISLEGYIRSWLSFVGPVVGVK